MKIFVIVALAVSLLFSQIALNIRKDTIKKYVKLVEFQQSVIDSKNINIDEYKRAWNACYGVLIECRKECIEANKQK